MSDISESEMLLLPFTRNVTTQPLSLLLQYLSKQNLALREVSDSRVKVYEQLEENISELEAANKKLVEEGKEDKGKIKR